MHTLLLTTISYYTIYRSGPSDWPGGDVAWREFRAKEPFNAHSHLIAIALGTSESVPISKGAMRIGTYQNIIVVSRMYIATWNYL